MNMTVAVWLDIHVESPHAQNAAFDCNVEMKSSFVF